MKNTEKKKIPNTAHIKMYLCQKFAAGIFRETPSNTFPSNFKAFKQIIITDKEITTLLEAKNKMNQLGDLIHQSFALQSVIK